MKIFHWGGRFFDWQNRERIRQKRDNTDIVASVIWNKQLVTGTINCRGRDTQREAVRHGVVRIPVSFSVTAKWLKKLAGYAKKDKISVQYFDVETAVQKLAEMYVTGYKAKLKKDTSYKGLWTVSFTLKEM